VVKVALALREPVGAEAIQLRVAEAYVTQFGNLAKAGNTLVVPANLTDVASMIALATNLVRQPAGAPSGAIPPGRA
jgi:hypothetical protein